MTRCVIACAIACYAVSALAQAERPLSSLTVPEGNLPTQCRLRPDEPSVATVPIIERAVVPLNLGSAFPFPSNPWTGPDRRLVLYARKSVDGPLEVPDGPPPSARELAAWEGRWVEHVVEAYRAVYDGSGGSVEISAIRFDDEKLTRSNGSRVVPRPRVASERFVAGAVVIKIAADGPTDCYKAVSDHVHRFVR